MNSRFALFALGRRLVGCVVTLTLAALAGTPAWAADDAGVGTSAAPQRAPRILHVMSYHAPWRWTEGQLQGFRHGLGVPAEVRVFQMDAKKLSTAEQKEAKGREARALIEQWKPDLVYTSDDEAQQYVASHYVGTALPIVFSGVNKPPRTYGFEGAPNVAGVLEHEHSVESVKLLRAMAPNARRFVAVFDDAPLWPSVQERMKRRMAAELPEVEFVAWDTITTFEEYKRKVAQYQTSADAIALIGVFNFKDEHGRNVPYQDVMKWTAENSRLPDFGYWIDRVHYGTLAAVTVSEREQGIAAGRIARGILVDGRKPSSFPMEPTLKGLPVISLARAQSLGLNVKSGLLLSAEVIQTYEWTK
jgi:ABC-type uncharacterized transport system substrate-binding protein